MSGAPRIQLCRLFERTSQRGNRYLTGRLGSAKVIAFEAADLPDDQRYGADVVWNVYLQAPDEERDQAPRQQQAERPQRLPERGQRTWDRSRDVERHAARSRAQAAGEAILQERGRAPGWSQDREETPFYDDSPEAIADLEGRR